MTSNKHCFEVVAGPCCMYRNVPNVAFLHTAGSHRQDRDNSIVHDKAGTASRRSWHAGPLVQSSLHKRVGQDFQTSSDCSRTRFLVVGKVRRERRWQKDETRT